MRITRGTSFDFVTPRPVVMYCRGWRAEEKSRKMGFRLVWDSAENTYRGGCWIDTPRDVGTCESDRSKNRFAYPDVGFRLARYGGRP